MKRVTKKVGKYEVGRTIGEGAFAKVKFAKNTETGESVAIKVLAKSTILKHKMVDQIKREISITKIMRHPNIVRLYEVLSSHAKIYIILEFINGGELFDKIVNKGKLSERSARSYFQQLIDAIAYCHGKGVYHRDLKPENLLLDSEGKLKVSDFGLSALPQEGVELLYTTCGTPNYIAPEVNKGKLSERSARSYFQQLIDAIAYCHGKGVYHRDLKPENLLLDSEGKLKVSDFGLSALPQEGVELLYTTCGTPNYIAPEVLSKKGYDGAAVDIWSCGVILYVLLAGYLPFEDSNLSSLYKKVNAADFSYPFWFPHNAKSLIDRILDPNPETRIQINGIREHPWFQVNYRSISHAEDGDVSLDDVQAVFEGIEDQYVTEKSLKESGPLQMNAFEMITLSQGLKLSALFDRHQKGSTLILITVFIEGGTMGGLGHESCFMGWVNAADFSYPFWFPHNAKSLIDRILDPNPETRIRIDGIREHPWFQVNYRSISHAEDGDVSLDDVQAVFEGIEDQYVTEKSLKESGPLVMNAFEMITLSQGLKLSALFDRHQDHVKRQTRFVSRKPAKDIITAIETVAVLLGFKVQTRGYKTRLEGASVNHVGQFAVVLEDHVKRQTRFVSRKPAKDIITAIETVAVLLGFKVQTRGYKTRLEGASVNHVGQFAVVLEVFEVAPSLFMVDVRKAAGDTLEYHKASNFIFYKNFCNKLDHIIWKSKARLGNSSLYRTKTY
ncbi:protein kinase domain-containing protein [Artemisia annua]|uniref:non-specific serine/threonine protein kinase n=1 Tax=Artemisia annua TaxID=35608 RepID=A0A2U1N1P8_ARTAN|nr:protein kinase domain-containing protein [Artemisia annua]